MDHKKDYPVWRFHGRSNPLLSVNGVSAAGGPFMPVVSWSVLCGKTVIGQQDTPGNSRKNRRNS